MPAVEIDQITHERLRRLSIQEELPVPAIIEHLVERYVDISHLEPFISSEHRTFDPQRVRFSPASIDAIFEELRNIRTPAQADPQAKAPTSLSSLP